jgi:hypothetical protein
MQHLKEEQLILFHYGEAESPEAIVDHLSRCASCRRHLESLTATLGSISSSATPPRGPEYGSEVWRRLAPELARTPRGGLTATLSEWIAVWRGAARENFLGWRWAAAISAAVAVALAAAFIAGMGWPNRPWSVRTVSTQAPAVGRANASSKLPLKELSEHLERSQLALLELINSKPNGPVDISGEQVLARDLVDMNRLFCRSFAQSGDGGTMSALEDLDRTLVEISSSPSKLSAEQFDELRSRILPGAVLCKIKLVGAQLRAQERETARNRS